MRTTVIYYTSNREHRRFERKIIDSLVKQSDGLDIISVSQKPISLGKNICVGNVGQSVFNAWRQLQIGVREAKTEFEAVATH